MSTQLHPPPTEAGDKGSVTRATGSPESPLSVWFQHVTRDRRCAVSTTRAYASDLNQLLSYCESPLCGKSITRLGRRDLLRFVELRAANGARVRSIARMVSSIKSFYSYLHAIRVVRTNPASSLSPPRYVIGPPQTITPDKASDIAPVGGTMKLLVRNRTIVVTLYSCGLLPSELVNLNVSDVSLAEHSLTVKGRRGATRRVPLSSIEEAVLCDWLAARNPNASDAVFTNDRGGRLTTRSIQNIVRLSYGQMTGSGTVTPRVLRHSCASHLLEDLAPIAEVRRLLGHATWSTHQAYHDLLKKQGRIKSIRRSKPRTQ